jgi:hypothetical protein
VTQVVDLNTLNVTATASTWSAKVYEVNYLARQYVTGDDVWVPFLDVISAAAIESNSLIHTGDIPVRVVIREPGFEPQLYDQTITTTGMSQASIENTDAIYTP